MDSFELKHAAGMGLVSQATADAELARRRQNGIFDRPVSGFAASNTDAAMGGYLMCSESGCNRTVDPKKGSYCDEHKKAESRSYPGPDFSPHNLDNELSAARTPVAPRSPRLRSGPGRG